MLEILVTPSSSVIGVVVAPFWPVVDLIVAERITSANLCLAAAALAIVVVLAAAVMNLYTATCRRVANQERQNYQPRQDGSRELMAGAAQGGFASTTSSEPNLRLRRIPRWGGAGALAWRQLLGARRHWGSLVTALIATAVLACAPCFVIEDSNIAFPATAGTLAFYTFLLLPTALRFDFRRDLDRLVTLKGLPITPAAAAIGQTLAPVLIATAFQGGVLTFAVVARSLPPQHLFMTMLVMIPLNVLVFGLDNLIFLLYPYRIHQEGLEILLRTMLTFTAKGLLFAVGLAAMSTWGYAAAVLTQGVSHWTGGSANAYAVFAGGMIVGPTVAAALVLYGLCGTYRNIDPVEDVPR